MVTTSPLQRHVRAFLGVFLLLFLSGPFVATNVVPTFAANELTLPASLSGMNISLPTMPNLPQLPNLSSTSLPAAFSGTTLPTVPDVPQVGSMTCGAGTTSVYVDNQGKRVGGTNSGQPYTGTGICRDLCAGGTETTPGQSTCPLILCCEPTSNGSSSSSTSSGSTTSSSSSVSSLGEGGGGGGGGSPVSYAAPTASPAPAPYAPSNGGRGSFLRPLAAATNFLWNLYSQDGVALPGTSQLMASAVTPAGNGSPRSPLTGQERRLLCSLVRFKANDRAGQETLLNDVAVHEQLATFLHRTPAVIKTALRDTTTCDAIRMAMVRRPSVAIATAAQAPVAMRTLVLGTDGLPMMKGTDITATVWNNCIRNHPTQTPTGGIYNCSRYRDLNAAVDGWSWSTPGSGTEVGWNPRLGKLTLPTEGLSSVTATSTATATSTVSTTTP